MWGGLSFASTKFCIFPEIRGKQSSLLLAEPRTSKSSQTLLNWLLRSQLNLPKLLATLLGGCYTHTPNFLKRKREMCFSTKFADKGLTPAIWSLKMDTQNKLVKLIVWRNGTSHNATLAFSKNSVTKWLS